MCSRAAAGRPAPGSPEGCAKFSRTLSGYSTEASEEEQELFAEDPLISGPRSRVEHEQASVYDLIAMSPLQPELGRWAASDVNITEWLEREWSPQQGATNTRREYLVDNRILTADTVGLAYRRSKTSSDRDRSIPGCRWSSTVAGVDEGDGWVKVGEHYLPKQLGGATVLTPRVEAMRDGPALTAEGRVLDLDGPSAIFFSHSRELSSGHDMKHELKEAARMVRAARLAQAAREAEARLTSGDACAVDEAGAVVGALPGAEAEAGGRDERASRLKRLRRLGLLRRRRAQTCGLGPDSVLCAGPGGRVFLLLSVEDPHAASERRRRRRSLRSRPKVVPDEAAEPAVFAIDDDGIVHC